MKKLILLIMIISIIPITACWDMVEIDERIFPYSIGVDLNPEDGEEYIITISYPNIFAIGSNASQEERIYVISTEGKSIFQAAEQLSTRLQYPFYFKHLRVIVIGHELAKDGESVRKIIDGVSRDFIINKKIRLVTTEGTAQELLLSIPKAQRQEVVEGALYSMLKDMNKTTRYTPQSLNGFIRDTDMSGVSTMPKAVFQGDDLKIFGACLFKDYKYIGHLGELENRTIALIKGKVKKDIIEAPFNETRLTYSINGVKSKKELVKEDGNLKIKINLELEGKLAEYIHKTHVSLTTNDELKAMENALETTLKEDIDKTIEKLQKEFNADLLGISEYLHKFHPNVWKKVSQDWDEIFPEMEIETSIKANIRRRGLVQ